MKVDIVNDSTCDSDVDLMGFLYGEMPADEDRKVQRHMAACEACSREFTLLSGTRQSVAEWQTVGFRALETPKFAFESDGGERLANSWSISKVFTTLRFQIPAFAALVLVASVGIYLSLSSASDENRNVSSAKADISQSTANSQASLAGSRTGSDAPVTATQESIANNPASVSGRPTLVPAHSSDVDGPKVLIADKQNIVNRKLKTQTYPSERTVAKGIQTRPSLNGYEENEDETLRLEDIFSEIDAS